MKRTLNCHSRRTLVYSSPMAVSSTFFATKRSKPLFHLLVVCFASIAYFTTAAAAASFRTKPTTFSDHHILPAAANTFQSLQAAVSETAKLSSLLSTRSVFSSNNNNNSQPLIVETQRGTIQDCEELHEITFSSLKKTLTTLHATEKYLSSTIRTRKIYDARVLLSAAMTNMDTCLDGLVTASGPLKPALVNSVLQVYNHVSNSLSTLPKSTVNPTNTERVTEHYPSWMGNRVRQFMKTSSGFDSIGQVDGVITVAKDGSGNFTTVHEAVKFAPKKSVNRTIIYVKEGVYNENVEISKHKINIVLWGDGMNKTVITGNRSVADGWTTFRSATVAVAGRGFLARDMTIQNTAGPTMSQAVALRINADHTAVYRCKMIGHQDTLYVHSYRQFYRECDVYGTVDFIFGNAAAVFQTCNIISVNPMPGQSTVVTAQSRKTCDQETGIVIQRSYILPSADLREEGVRSYLGRPWRNYSRTVVVESYIDGFIDPAGWSKWSDDRALRTLYYGEYGNYGPGSSTDKRVQWPGFHLMGHEDAANFTVSRFITGDQWLQSTSIPYDDGL